MRSTLPLVKNHRSDQRSQIFEKLSGREQDVLKLIVEGHSNSEIASLLHLSHSTVKTHVRGIFNKLGVDHRVQAAVIALRSGLV